MHVGAEWLQSAQPAFAHIFAMRLLRISHVNATPGAISVQVHRTSHYRRIFYIRKHGTPDILDILPPLVSSILIPSIGTLCCWRSKKDLLDFDQCTILLGIELCKFEFESLPEACVAENEIRVGLLYLYIFPCRKTLCRSYETFSQF